MLKLALSFLLALCVTTGAQAQIAGSSPQACNQVYQVSQGAVGLTKIVTGVASGKIITLCGFSFNAGSATATAQIEYGTGTNCATGTTAITPAVSLGINGSFVDHPAVPFYSLPQNTDLCLVTTGTGPMQVLIYYGQF